MRRPLQAILLLLVLSAAACGYRLQPEGKGRFSDPAVRIDLSPLVNDSSEPDAGTFVAARLREELRRRGFEGSYGRVGADFQVTGKVREFRDEVFSRTSGRFALENRFTLVVEIRVVDTRQGTVLWKDEDLVETVSYYAGSDAEYTASNRRAAFEETVRRMALRMAQTIRLIL
jgi:hypothetical protein